MAAATRRSILTVTFINFYFEEVNKLALTASQLQDHKEI